MKLNPEELDVVTFDTTAADEAQAAILCPNTTDPTPQTYCFVCD